MKATIIKHKTFTTLKNVLQMQVETSANPGFTTVYISDSYTTVSNIISICDKIFFFLRLFSLFVNMLCLCISNTVYPLC